MGWMKNYPRAYYEKYERVEVQNGGGWYEVYRLPGNVYAICEPQHFQEVNIYLILGQERAALLDTGEGFVPIEPLIRELWDGEIVAFNSHFHFDHIAANHLFQPMHVWEAPHMRQVAKHGLPKEALGAQLDEEMFQFGYPVGLDVENFRIQPYAVEPVADGERFDLGGRTLQVLHTPGHSEDSIMLCDEGNRILFTGDTFYLGALYTHFDCPEFGHGSVKTYLQTMERLAQDIPADVRLYCSHNDFIAPHSKLGEAAEGLWHILERKSSAETTEIALGHTYLEGRQPMAEHFCDGFSIVYKVAQ